jgi:Cdc6-like AAA superfamily ATPase
MAKEPDWKTLGLKVGLVFRPSAPVDEEKLFAGRIDQMRRVADAVNQPGRHAVIFGERGVGKTSLVSVLSKRLGNPAGTLAAVRVNCNSADDYSSLWHKVFSQFEIFESTRRMGFGQGQEEHTRVPLRNQLPEKITPSAVISALGLISTHSVPVIILDEFDRLAPEVTRLVADTIKTLSDQNITSTLVLVGVADAVSQLISQHESTERALVQVPIERMTRDELNEILDKGLGVLDMTIDARSRSFITLISQGLPTYTHALALHAARAAIDEETSAINYEHTSSATLASLQDAEQSVRSLYDAALATPQGETLYPAVLLACALVKCGELGFFSAGDVRMPLRAITGRNDIDIPNFAKHLKEFSQDVRGPVLQRTGGSHRVRYRFTKPLLQPYIIIKALAEKRITETQISAISPWEPRSVL